MQGVSGFSRVVGVLLEFFGVFRVYRVQDVGFIGFIGFIGCIGFSRVHSVYRVCGL